MNVVPRTREGLINFYETHLATWALHAADIGTSPETIAALTLKAQAARAAYGHQHEVQQAARAATLELDLTLEALATAGAIVIRQIRTRAAAAGNGVYSLASIPPPDAPSPAAAPGTPYLFSFALQPVGVLKLMWKCDNPRGTSGTMYHVWRRIDAGAAPGAAPSGAFTHIGASGKKSFLDETLPRGASQVTYQVQAVRSTKAGEPAQYHINFGVAPGQPTSYVVRRAARKLAA